MTISSPIKWFLLGLVVVLTAWFAISNFLIRSPFIFPGPDLVLKEMWKLAKTGELFTSLFNTFLKAILGLSLSLLVGVFLGFLMGIFNWFNLMFKPFAMVLRSVPIVSWLSTVLFLWGIGWRSVLFIVFVTLLPQIMFNVAEGVRSVDVKLVEMAKIYRVSKRKIFKSIYLGSLLPFLVSAINVSIGTMWKSAIVAEYLLGGTGLGVRIQEAKFFINTPRVFALTLSAVVVGLGLEFAFSWLWEKKLYGKGS